jgi:hypothetical protein
MAESPLVGSTSLGLLDEFFTDSVTYEAYDGTRDEAGDPNYATGIAYTAYIRGGQFLVRDSDSKETISTVRATFNSAPGFDHRGRFTLPSRFRPNQPRVLMIKRVADENGPHHEVVFFR